MPQFDEIPVDAPCAPRTEEIQREMNKLMDQLVEFERQLDEAKAEARMEAKQWEK